MKTTIWILVLFFLTVEFTCAESKPEDRVTRTEIVHQIEADASDHASTNTPMKEEWEVQLYRNNDAGLTPEEISQIYKKKYREVYNKKSSNLPWWIASASLLLAFFGKMAKTWLEDQSKKLYESVYQRHAGARLFRRRALRRYSRSIVRQHQSFKIPFRDEPLEMRDVYVPLKVADTTSATPVDALDAIRQYRRLMVKGNPGTGKSMLLRSLLLSYADGLFATLDNNFIPVLVELNRLNDPATNLQNLIEESFARYGFPRSAHFVRWSLDHDGLMLLLDGLDEVNTKDRARVARAVNDFVQQHHPQVVVTCRTQVYRDEFSGVMDKTLEISEFLDTDILRLLKAWGPRMQQGQSVEHLMQTLRERPRILMLARNPLLLTMMAYLYVDAQIALPRSRAEFYAKSTSLLLEKWQGAFNRFGAPAKNAVLSRLALSFQDKPAEDRDRRSIPFQEVLGSIREILPGVGVKPEEASDLLDEIVDRSGIMLRIDAGARFQFAHLTIQEYFAATALIEDRSSLLERFRNDPDTWREVVKLWCGLTQDATDMIGDVQGIEEITALECLADAKFVHPPVADTTVNRMRSALGSSTDPAIQEPLAKAFGLLASIPGPRGAETFKWLSTELKSEKLNVRVAAAKSLAYSNRDEAAIELAASASPEAEAALESMGDIAVRPLAGAKKPSSLVRIGTPQALEATVLLLWDQDEQVCTEAAWSLAKKIADPRVETVLRGAVLPGKATGAPAYSWIWQPFRRDGETDLSDICGRMGFLLAASPRPDPIDPRLALPLYVETREPAFLERLPQSLQEKLSQAIKKLRPPTREDWLRVFRPTDYRFCTSRLFRFLKLLFVAFFVAGIAAIIAVRKFAGFFKWWNLALLVASLLQAFCVSSIWFIPDETTEGEGGFTNDVVLASFTLLAIPAIRSVEVVVRFRAFIEMLLALLIFGTWTPLAIFYCSKWLLKVFAFRFVVLLWVGLYLFGIASYVIGYRLELQARNPLHGLLESQKTAPGMPSSGSSWITRVFGSGRAQANVQSD